LNLDHIVFNQNAKRVGVESLRIEMGRSVESGKCYIYCSFIEAIHHTYYS